MATTLLGCSIDETSELPAGFTIQFLPPDPNPLFAIIDVNREKLDADCQAVIEAIKEQFIDVAPILMDDENSNYIDQIIEKQGRFKQDFTAKLTDQQTSTVFAPSFFEMNTADTGAVSEHNDQATMESLN